MIANNSTLIGKIKKNNIKQIQEKLMKEIFKKEIIKDTSVKSGKTKESTCISTKIIRKKKSISIIIHCIEKRNLEIGDKLSGRHGNKGVVAKIKNRENMPFTQDGRALDIIMNPLGIPSRMNIGQVFECLLGFSADSLKEIYEVKGFYEKQGNKTSSNIVYNKLFEARKKSKKKWIFNPNNPGKSYLISSKTGEKYKEPINIGYSYILKLIHLVEDKINARMTGNYSLITQQPLKGKSKNGGQRIGEMEIWAIEGYGAAYTLQELLTIKSDDTNNRIEALTNLMNGKKLPLPDLAKTTKIFIIELQALCLEIILNTNGREKTLIEEK
jgi:DNA-directed RNA polymerase subunit beta